MSYRDVRNLLEYVRALGFPRHISMESFREPNFSLVAEILTWLVERYDPNSTIPTDIDTEQDRVLFIKAVAQFMATQASISLNTKKIYRADGHAVKELLKVASVLYIAMTSDTDHQETGAAAINISSFDLGSKATELKTLRALASEITTRGSNLHEMLGHEVELRDERSAAIAKPLEIDSIERGLRQTLAAVQQRTDNYKSLIDNVKGDEENLKAKIEKKKMELERNKKRLQSLQSVRPAFMDEYEELEVKLNVLYEKYIEKYRNLTYLESELEQHNQTEQEKIEATEESLRRMQQRLKEEEQRMATGQRHDDGNFSSDDDDDDLGLIGGSDDLDDTDLRRGQRDFGAREAMGSLNDGDEQSDDESAQSQLSGSLGSESSLLNGSDDDDDDDGDLSGGSPSDDF
eukprot:m.31394 g.31394  ORF g.31394 m.31394 type:complete len:404 (-) comp8313_c0_seq1:387-1598(-)